MKRDEFWALLWTVTITTACWIVAGTVYRFAVALLTGELQIETEAQRAKWQKLWDYQAELIGEANKR